MRNLDYREAISPKKAHNDPKHPVDPAPVGSALVWQSESGKKQNIQYLLDYSFFFAVENLKSNFVKILVWTQ